MDIFTVIRGNRFFFPAACAAALALIFISEGSYLQSVRALDNISTMGEASTSILVLQHKLLNAETGQRGYLLTHRQAYLEPYRSSFAEIDQALAALATYYADKPAMQSEFVPLRALVVVKRSELEATIRLVDEGKIEAAMAIVMGDEGKDTMDAIRNIFFSSAGDRTPECGRTAPGRVRHLADQPYWSCCTVCDQSACPVCLLAAKPDAPTT